MTHAVFSIFEVGDDVLALVDHDRGMSITNDAEYVIAVLAGRYDLAKRRVIYRDTMGMWDELVHEHGCFKRFRCFDLTSREDAVARVRAEGEVAGG